MTAVQWLIKELNLEGYDHTIQQAKEMHENEAFEYWNGGIKSTEEGGKSFDQYYQETFVSKGSGMSEKPNNHIEVELPQQEKDINYWKNNCEEDYMTTPISVLRYISELEKLVALPQQEICISCDEQKETHKICMDCIGKMIKENQTEISDEEIKEKIEKALNNFKQEHTVLNLYPSNMLQNIAEFGAKWYREQLKTKKD
jgi:ribosomal protein L32